MRKTSKKMSRARRPIQLGNIRSLTEFQRNAKQAIREMKRTGEPQVLTVKGKAELVVQDATAYQHLLNEIDRADAVRGIREGLKDLETGRTLPVERTLSRIRKKFGIQDPNHRTR